MKLATLRTGGNSTTAALAMGADAYLPLPAPDVGALLSDPEWRNAVEAIAAAASDADVVHASAAELAPLLPQAGKVICCGLNYSDHIREMGRELPEFPTLFAKYADTLTGAADAIEVHGSSKVDWEAELAVVVGLPLFRADEDQARHAIAGYTVANDVSMRDWQNRTLQWFQGKAFDATTPVGPVMVTTDDADGDFDVRGYVNGELVQSGNTSTLVFSPARLLSYISQFTVLRPGDLVLTGTPGGVGMGMKPPRFLNDGDVLTTEIDGIGRLENSVRIHQNDAGAAVRTPVTATSTKE
ncbi:2-hydroxyhepta-2,4-diene-1,7-dioate isomerase [Pseudarthrobacter psychrotolerans]|uniref:2-hydroxyhepta-2,4-diene-1,7-dioate isomerase n=1 Tax=Pseudarthrobacter psychrotolerans TaxID=2697569 RepID=A0A6P1NH45_9MICC|nr:fumarylacetoacetate hydrolase family protein [Pseudarthrobacter psychrotolerans]QHK18483.1 2-hydroxyhepta-2,4-diene-1,7-dioate isomerase [Pseudarthrobacter psychrotolerans]